MGRMRPDDAPSSHRQAETCYTKFEVSNYTHYENVKGGAKCTKRDGLGAVREGVNQGHVRCHYSIERERLLIRLQ